MPKDCTERGSVATTRMRKVECVCCGYTVRVSRRWMAVGLPVCPCGERMDSVDALRDGYELAEWSRRDAAAALREGRAGHGGERRLHCEWCGAFVPHGHAECGACGHRPDIQVGHRQNHNSLSMRNYRAAGMPF